MFNKVMGKFYNHADSLNFINKINGISRGIKLDNGIPKQLANGISFNFYKNKVSLFKLYCEIYKQLESHALLNFLPTLDDYDKYIKFWDKNRQSGLCLGFKLNRLFQPINYFHIKFGTNYTFKQALISKDISTLNHNTGISYEYTGNSAVEKKYIYFYDKDEIKFLLEKFNIKEDFRLLNHIEYTESNNYQKIILVYDLVNFKNNKTIIGESPVQRKCIDYFWKIHNILPVYRGKYDNNICSYYWSLTNNKLNNFLNIK